MVIGPNAYLSQTIKKIKKSYLFNGPCLQVVLQNTIGFITLGVRFV